MSENSKTDAYRMFVELPNGAKFRAAGEVQEVRADLDRFYALLNGTQKPAAKAAHADTLPLFADTATTGNGTNAVEAVDQLTGNAELLDSALPLERLFAKDKNGTVSLRALPHGDNAEADAMIALIYGAAKIGGEHQVTGSRLMKAATQSGLHQVDRIDRSLSTLIGQFVTAAGFKKGRRYGLTNPGIRRAEDALRGILG